MIKESTLDVNNDIIKFANELKLLIPNIEKYGWYKKFVCTSDNKDYIKSQSFNKISNFIVHNKLIDIITIVNTIMNDNGFNNIIDYSNIEKINVEFHYANTDNENYEYPWSGIHNDNVNGILVNTFICYFDVECEGGELAIYDLDENILSKIDVSSKSLNKKIIMFSGDVIHNPLKLINGHRYALSFQIPI